MKLIVLSRPNDFKGEIQILCSLFEAGLQRFHLRKPEASKADMQAYLSQLPQHWYPRIVLHQHWEVGEEMSLGGIHVPEWRRLQFSLEEWDQWILRAHTNKLTMSTSVHQMETLDQLNGLDYTFLSPVFPSISKPGYGPQEELTVNKQYPFEIYALGGVDTGKLEEVAKRGFDGAAVLGTIWQEPEQALVQFLNIQDQLTLNI